MTVERCVGLTILPEYIQTEGIDGILGFALFGDALLTLDYPAQELRVAEGCGPWPNQRQ